MLPRKNRYSFWKVFWVVLAFYLFFGVLGYVLMYLSPVKAVPGLELKKLFTWSSLLAQVLKILFSAGFFFFSINTYYRLFAERKSIGDFIKPLVISAIALGVFYIGSLFYMPEQQQFKKAITLPLIVVSFGLSIIFNIGLAMLIAYLTYLRDEKKQQKILEEQKMQLEVEKSQANFNFLKAQINPHFLHNTLNFLYAKSLPYSAELSEGILTLSDIMRYALSEGNARDGKAPLKDEIEHVRNVIKINQLRFSNNLKVSFDVDGVVNGATIIPFVLITIVENAFKHGDLKNNDDPIIVKAKIEGQQLYFYCRNRKKSGPKELSTGIGLENIRKRLELAYGKDYDLRIKDEADYYTTELTITKL